MFRYCKQKECRPHWLPGSQVLPCVYSTIHWGDRWRVAWNFGEHRRPGDLHSGNVWLHRKPSIHSGETVRFKVCIYMIYVIWVRMVI